MLGIDKALLERLNANIERLIAMLAVLIEIERARATNERPEA